MSDDLKPQSQGEQMDSSDLKEAINASSGHSPESLALQSELAALDSEWALEKARFWSSRSHSRLPTLGSGLETAVRALVSGLGFALFTGFIARGATSAGASRVFWILPLFGVVIMIYGAVSLLAIAPKARAYQRSEADYNTKRASLEARITNH